ncbi:hypothetical protein ATKI12_7953 [Kitasatospora sp. Ki12]
MPRVVDHGYVRPFARAASSPPVGGRLPTVERRDRPPRARPVFRRSRTAGFRGKRTPE